MSNRVEKERIDGAAVLMPCICKIYWPIALYYIVIALWLYGNMPVITGLSGLWGFGKKLTSSLSMLPVAGGSGLAEQTGFIVGFNVSIGFVFKFPLWKDLEGPLLI